MHPRRHCRLWGYDDLGPQLVELGTKVIVLVEFWGRSCSDCDFNIQTGERPPTMRLKRGGAVAAPSPNFNMEFPEITTFRLR